MLRTDLLAGTALDAFVRGFAPVRADQPVQPAFGRLVVAVMVSYPDGQRRTYQYLEGQTGVDAGAGATTKIDGGGEEQPEWQPGSDEGTGDDWGGDSGDSGDSGDDWGDSGGDSDFGDWSF